MNENYAVVDYRWNEKYRAQEFIQKNSYEIQRAVSNFDATGDNLVIQIANFIRDEFTYPLINEQPSCDGQFVRFKISFLGNYRFKKCVFYMWSFPVETLALFHAGICIDTANLATTLLRAKKHIAWTCLGEVRKTSTDELLGYHAWTETIFKKETWLNETTIHKKGAKTLIPATDAYDKNSEFAKRGNVYYVLHAKYNESQYIGVTDLGTSGIVFTLMGLPQKRLKLMGLEKVLEIKPKKLYNEWKREELEKQEKVFAAWR